MSQHTMSRALQRVGKSLWQACASSAPAAGASLGTAAAAASRRAPAASSSSSHAAQAAISAWRQQQARTALALVQLQTPGTSSMLSPRLLSSTGRHGQQQQCGEGRQLCACRPAVRVKGCGHEHLPHVHAGKRQRQMGLQGATKAGREGNQVLTVNSHSASRSTQQARITRQVQGVWVGVLLSASDQQASARIRTDSDACVPT